MVEIKSWELFQIVTLSLTLLPIFIDFHIGLWGQSSMDLTIVKFIFMFIVVTTIGWWMYLFLNTSSKSNQLALFVMPTVLGFFGNGIIGIIGCFPPCAGAYPWQDINHFGIVIFGFASTYTTYNVLKENQEEDPAGLMKIVIFGVLIVLFFTLQFLLFEL